MNLIPYRKNASLLDELFDWPLASLAADRVLDAGDWSPSIDVHDSKDAVTVRAELPGVNKEDIDVTVRDGMLTIRGEKKAEHETKDHGVVRSERFFGSFLRAIELPSTVDQGAIKAAYKNGVLQLTLPKKEEAKPKQIKIDVN